MTKRVTYSLIRGDTKPAWSVQSTGEWRDYVPPSFEPVRPGAADYRRHPSVSAGQSRPYWAAPLIARGDE